MCFDEVHGELLVVMWVCTAFRIPPIWSGLSSTKALKPSRRSVLMRSRCSGRGVSPRVLTSTKPILPDGSNTMRLGTPAVPGEVNFQQTPPAAFTAATSFLPLIFLA